MNAEFDRDDPLLKPLTIAEVMRRTGRTRKTIDRWIKAEMLRTVRLGDPPETVLIERQVIEVEQRMRAASKASRDAIAARGGRPGARPSAAL